MLATWLKIASLYMHDITASFAYVSKLCVGQVTSMENWQKFEYSNLNYSALLELRIINEVPINRSQLDVICVQKAKRNTKY